MLPGRLGQKIRSTLRYLVLFTARTSIRNPDPHSAYVNTADHGPLTVTANYPVQRILDVGRGNRPLIGLSLRGQ